MKISRGLVGYLIGLTVVFAVAMWFVSGGSTSKTAAMVATALAVLIAGYGLIMLRRRTRR